MESAAPLRQPMADNHVAMAQPWDQWLTDSLNSLRSADLLRTLRPVVPTLNAVEACPYLPLVLD